MLEMQQARLHCCKKLPAKASKSKEKCLKEEETKYIKGQRDTPSDNPIEMGLFTIKAVTNQYNEAILIL